MKKLIAVLAFALMFATTAGAVDEYRLGDKWMINGGGFAKKTDALKAELSLSGTLDVHSEIVDDIEVLTGYTLNMRLDATRFNIRAWKINKTETFTIPTPIPTFNPTNNEPYTLPFTIKHDGLKFNAVLTSVNSGTIKIYGNIDIDVVGTVELDSSSDFWRNGTRNPQVTADNSKGGCSAGFGVLPLLGLTVLGLVKSRFGKKG